MNRKLDYIQFTHLLALLNEMSGRTRDITEETIEGYFLALQDLPIESIKQNGFIAIRLKGFFPTIPELAGNFDPTFSDEAQEAYDLLSQLIRSHGMQYGKGKIKASLKEKGFEHLFPMLSQWGNEIDTSENATATRSQFINQYKALQRKYTIQLLRHKYKVALPANDQKQINGDVDV